MSDRHFVALRMLRSSRRLLRSRAELRRRKVPLLLELVVVLFIW